MLFLVKAEDLDNIDFKGIVYRLELIISYYFKQNRELFYQTVKLSKEKYNFYIKKIEDKAISLAELTEFETTLAKNGHINITFIKYNIAPMILIENCIGCDFANRDINKDSYKIGTITNFYNIHNP